MNKLTIEEVEAKPIGESLCDMHYGLPVVESQYGPVEAQVAEVAVDVAEVLIERAARMGLRSYLNKMLWVVGRRDGVTTACYIYDGRYAKIITFGGSR